MILRLGCIIATATALAPTRSKLPRPVSRVARPPATMSQTQKSNKSKLQTIVKDKIEEDTKTKEDLNIDACSSPGWLIRAQVTAAQRRRAHLRVRDLHDPENNPTVSNAKAYQLTMTTHCEGVSTVTQTAKPSRRSTASSCKRAA